MRGCLLIIGLLLALPAQAEEPLRLLILPFDNATGQARHDPLQEGLSDMLTACFTRYSETIEVVDRDSFGHVIEEQSLGREGVTRGDFQRIVGRLSGAGARFWLAQSFYKAGLVDFAAIELKKFLDTSSEHSRREQAIALLEEIERRRGE